MKCIDCQADNPDSSRFCSHCGSSQFHQDNSDLDLTATLKSTVSNIIPGAIFAGRYEIIKELGRGGMGVVYKAEDSKLKRTIALKSIRPNILSQEEEKGRFLREAQASAALNHPNICTVFEIDEAAGTSFIAMEYIEGQSLRQLVEKRPLKFDDTLRLAIQISEGLHHAHKNGIIHRDIKTSNIMLRGEQVKIMDFGLAKLADSSAITLTGTTLGTILYMSPEQASGKPVDARTDIWSLGVVLYEMITGVRPFCGDRDQAVIHSILTMQPEALTALRSGIPLPYERIVNRCLEKDPNLRYQSALDLLADLRRLKRDWEAGNLHADLAIEKKYSRPPGVFDYLKWASLVFTPFLIAALLYLIFSRPNSVSEQKLARYKLIPLTGGEGLFVSPSWSPDGDWITYASDQSGNMDIWKKPARGGKATQLTRSVYDERQPDWSPDGRRIAFSSNEEKSAGIFLIPVSGGSPWQLTNFGNNPTWSPDSKSICFDWRGDIYVVRSMGGQEPKQVVTGTSCIPYAAWASEGNKLIYWDRNQADICLLSFAEGTSSTMDLIDSGYEVSGISVSSDGHEMVFSQGPFGGNKNLWRVDLDPIILLPSGEPTPLSITSTDDIQCALSPDGKQIAYTVSHLQRHLWAYTLDKTSGLIMGEPHQLSYESNNNYYPSFSLDGEKLIWTSHVTSLGALSIKPQLDEQEIKATSIWGDMAREIGGSFAPDGKRVCYASTQGGSFEIWMLPTLGSVELRLTEAQGPSRDAFPAWSPRGEKITFYSTRAGNWDIWSVDVDNNNRLQQLTHWPSNENYHTWSPDGTEIAFRTDKEGNGDIWIMDENGNNPIPYEAHPAVEGWASWSPDKHWFYFTSNRSGAFNVWIKPSAGGEARQVTNYSGHPYGMPDFDLFTKFAVSSNQLIIPLESRRGNIYILKLGTVPTK